MKHTGLCNFCGKEPPMIGSGHCERCAARLARGRRRTGRRRIIFSSGSGNQDGRFGRAY